MYGSLEVQAVRLLLAVPSDKVTTLYNSTGAFGINWGDTLQYAPTL